MAPPPVLNWQELQIIATRLRAEAAGMFLERVFIPGRARFPSGYIKAEWGLRLTSRKQEAVLVFSVRPRHPYVSWLAGKGPKAAPTATHSAFDLSLSKHLKGLRLEAVEALPRERTLLLTFASAAEQFALILNLIPAVPEALLVRRIPPGTPPSDGWPILARSRTVESASGWLPPDGSKAPEAPPVRDALVGSLDTLRDAIEGALDEEAFALRLLAARRSLKDLLKQARDRKRQSEAAIREGEGEPDWQRYGDHLKACLHDPPPLVRMSETTGSRQVMDYQTGEPLEIPCDPRLGPSEQVEKFYQAARRKLRRISEARSRIEGWNQTITRVEHALALEPAPGDWAAVERLEGLTGAPAGPSAPAGRPKAKSGWLGRTFRSKEGLTIWVGKSRDENLELTFRQARGNDLWLHVRGRPGAHVVVPLQSGKSASLETLLDAATLAIYYSGGEHWGKTEVDYAFKKHVKRIKDSTEASYTHNKTLIVQVDPARLKNLLSQLGEQGK